MKCFLIILLIVLIRTEIVSSKHDIDHEVTSATSLPTKKPTKAYEAYPGGPNNTSTMKPPVRVNDPNVIRVPLYGIYLMGFTIGLLFLIVLCLVAIIYRLKYKVYSESIGDKIKITETECSTKPRYQRHLSSGSNDVSFTRHNNMEHESKITIADYPTSHVDNDKKPAKPLNDLQNVSKKFNPHLGPMQKEQIEKICQGVLSKTQRLNEANSLSNLDKILNERSNTKEPENPETIDKSASSPFLDVAEDFKFVPSPISAKKVFLAPPPVKKVFPTPAPENNNFPPPSPVKKFEELPDCTLKRSDNGNGQKERKYPIFRLPPINNKANNALVKNDTNDNSPKSNRSVLTKTDEHDDDNDNTSSINRSALHSNSDKEQLDDVYDNPPNINRPIIHINDDDEHLDDVYDNPPVINRPVLNNNADNAHVDDVYDNPTNINRPVLRKNSNNDHVDDVYDNPQSNRPVTNPTDDLDNIYDDLNVFIKDVASSSTHKPNRSSKKEDLNDYDCPHASSRGIIVDDDNESGYLIAITNDKESCFDQCYINAKSLNKSLNNKY